MYRFCFLFCYSLGELSTMGDRPAVFPEYHDEDRATQTHRAHGILEKVGSVT